MGSGSGYFPEEIIEDILVKLPVKSIIRFKSVSKSWFNLIKSTNFMYKRSQEDICFHAMCFLGYDERLWRSFLDVCILDDDDDDHKETSASSSAIFSSTSQKPQASDYKWFTLPLLPCPYMELVGNCNGILCFSSYGEITLVNPLLSEVKTLPRGSTIGVALVGFGFDNSTDDFKVVRIVNFQTHQAVQVFNLRSNAWRELNETGIPLVSFTMDNMCSTFLDGKVYWCVKLETESTSQGDRILAFNLATELFELMEFPQGYPMFSTKARLIVLNQESLAFVSCFQFYSKENSNDKLVHLWTMSNIRSENEQVTTIWTKLCSFQEPPHLLSPISFSKKLNKFLYQTVKDHPCQQLIVYDVINQSSSSIVQESQLHQYGNNLRYMQLQVQVWRPSLISLN